MSNGDSASKPRRATIVDVALAAGVSRQTVTRAMNDMPGISDQTRRRVLESARSLAYRPSRFGRGLVKPGALTLGLVINDLTNPFYAELASSILKIATELGWTLLVAENLHDPVEAEKNIVKLTNQVDGVVGYLEQFSKQADQIFGDIPVVNLEPWAGVAGRATLEIDFEEGLNSAVRHLVAHGRRRIGMIDSSPTGDKSLRALIYENILGRQGLEPNVATLIMGQARDSDAGATGTRLIREREPATDAIIAFNDVMAIGAMKQLRNSSISVPDDVAVIGIDGLPIGALVVPELTTLSLDTALIARRAMEMIVGMAEGTLPLRGEQVMAKVEHSLVVRSST